MGPIFWKPMKTSGSFPCEFIHPPQQKWEEKEDGTILDIPRKHNNWIKKRKRKGISGSAAVKALTRRATKRLDGKKGGQGEEIELSMQKPQSEQFCGVNSIGTGRKILLLSLGRSPREAQGVIAPLCGTGRSEVRNKRQPGT